MTHAREHASSEHWRPDAALYLPDWVYPLAMPCRNSTRQVECSRWARTHKTGWESPLMDSSDTRQFTSQLAGHWQWLSGQPTAVGGSPNLVCGRRTNWLVTALVGS